MVLRTTGEVRVGVGVAVDVSVGVGVEEAPGDFVGVGVSVAVAVGVSVAVGVGVAELDGVFPGNNSHDALYRYSDPRTWPEELFSLPLEEK